MSFPAFASPLGDKGRIDGDNGDLFMGVELRRVKRFNLFPSCCCRQSVKRELSSQGAEQSLLQSLGQRPSCVSSVQSYNRRIIIVTRGSLLRHLSSLPRNRLF